jgi:hypothetical protein
MKNKGREIVSILSLALSISVSAQHITDTSFTFPIKLTAYQPGKGKVAVFGEAAMFTAQIANGTLKAGFNSELAPKNAQFTLNLIHWLHGSLNTEKQ